MEQQAATVELFARLDVIVTRDNPRRTFVTTALGRQVIRAAERAGFAAAEDIDHARVLGCAHPRGPLALTELIGLDTAMVIAQSVYGEFKEPLHPAPPLLLRMVDAGLLGRKRPWFYTCQ